MTALSSTVEGNNDLYLKASSFKRYTIYGDDLTSVTAELTLRWPHIIDEEEDYRWQRRFCQLAEYLEKEGLFS